MATPTLQQARRHHARQAETAAAAATAVRQQLESRRPWSEILTTFAAYQLASATSSIEQAAIWSGLEDLAQAIEASIFAGVSSAGFAISEPLVATIDRLVPAPAQDLPAPWWGDPTPFIGNVMQLVASEVQDAGRSAAQTSLFATEESQTRYYARVLVPPTCKRCVLLAGRIYQDLEAFERHPGCDCENVEVDSPAAAREAGILVTAAEAYERGWIRALTVAERAAIEDGADIHKVINSSSGIQTADLFGHRVSATTYGTTKRSRWRKRNPSRLVRLRPESIYRIAAGDRVEAVRLLRLYGYLDPLPA